MAKLLNIEIHEGINGLIFIVMSDEIINYNLSPINMTKNDDHIITYYQNRVFIKHMHSPSAMCKIPSLNCVMEYYFLMCFSESPHSLEEMWTAP